MTENIRDPFAEIESRQVADWKNFLVAQPDALETAGASSATIRQWEDIPDVASFPSSGRMDCRGVDSRGCNYFIGG